MTASNGHECVSKILVCYFLYFAWYIFCISFYHIVIESEILINEVYTWNIQFESFFIFYFGNDLVTVECSVESSDNHYFNIY